MRYVLLAAFVLMLSGCFVLNKEHYEAVESLNSHYEALDARDRQLSEELEGVKRGDGKGEK